MDNITTVAAVAAAIEEFAPLALQATYDNSGLIVGRVDREVTGVLIAVDLTQGVIEEARSRGANMVVTHHPIIFNPLRRLTGADYVERAVEMAVKRDVAVYAAHTNLDSAPGGMSWRVGEMLGVEAMRTLDEREGYGVVGELRESLSVEQMLERIASRFSVEALRHSDIVAQSVRRVAICTGSGGSLLSAAIAQAADIYITSDLRYNDFFAAQKGVTMVDIGHYESEYCAIDLIFDILSKKMFNFALHKSLCGVNPVHYRSYKQ